MDFYCELIKQALLLLLQLETVFQLFCYVKYIFHDQRNFAHGQEKFSL